MAELFLLTDVPPESPTLSNENPPATSEKTDNSLRDNVIRRPRTDSRSEALSDQRGQVRAGRGLLRT